jgi:hypothetical protein
MQPEKRFPTACRGIFSGLQREEHMRNIEYFGVEQLGEKRKGKRDADRLKRQMMNMGSDGGKARVKSLRTAAAEFPRAFLDLLNAKCINTDDFDEYSTDLTFAPRPPSNPAPQKDTKGASLLRRSGPSDYHQFSAEEIEEQESLRDVLSEGAVVSWFQIFPEKGTRHLCVFPVLVCYLRSLADRIMRGAQIDDNVMEFWGRFQRQIRHLLMEHEYKSMSADDTFTMSNCHIAQRILKAFTEVQPASLALLHKCENPECRRYFLRKSIRPQRFHSKPCSDRHAYRLRQK